LTPQDPLCLMYTTGTMGRPKGAVLTHGALMGNARALADWLLGFLENDMALAAMPLFHVGGMWYHLFPTFVGIAEIAVRDDRIMLQHRPERP